MAEDEEIQNCILEGILRQAQGSPSPVLRRGGSQRGRTALPGLAAAARANPTRDVEKALYFAQHLIDHVKKHCCF